MSASAIFPTTLGVAAAVILAAVAAVVAVGMVRRSRRGAVGWGRGGIDELTGSLDRRGLARAIDAMAVDRMAVDGMAVDDAVAMLFVRLDRLDRINGSIGRDFGDESLRRTAERLRDAAPPDASVARVSGSTFAVLVPDPLVAAVVAPTVVAAASVPLTVGGIELSPSCGAVLVTVRGARRAGVQVLDHADAVARRHLGATVEVVEHVDLDLDAEGAADAAEVAAAVRKAVLDGSIVAAYQPIVDLRTMEPVGCEALARWPDAPAGYEEPERFLDVVGALGLHRELLDGMLRRVCADFADGPVGQRGWWVSVNLGLDDVVDQALPARVRQILRETGLDPRRLVLEVSERAVPDPGMARALRKLSTLGVRLAIDDFGSGWSSLSQLRSLPIEILKIDRSLVSTPTAADSRLTLSVIALADALGLETLAEGVESGEDLLFLCVADCRYGQGFWWSAPTELDAILEQFPARASTLDDDPPPIDVAALVVDAHDDRSLADGPEIMAWLESSLRDLASGHRSRIPREGSDG